jgi:hypothetical protein
MAKAKLSEAIKGVSTRMGNLIYRQMPDGTTVVNKIPEIGHLQPIKGGKDHQQRLQEAARYARWAAKAQPIYAELAKQKNKTAYHLARTDWFNPPVIHEVRLKENIIRVQASDNIMVTKVIITIRDEQGKLLEAGEAIRQEGDWWEYIPHITGKTITAEAWDLPGNVNRFVL